MRRLFGSMLIAIGLAMTPFFLGCESLAAVRATPGGGETARRGLPELSGITTPDTAEEILFVGVQAYAFAMGEVNSAYTRGEISEERYGELVGYALQFRQAATAAYQAISLWRSFGQRANFDTAYLEARLMLSKLKPQEVP